MRKQPQPPDKVAACRAAKEKFGALLKQLRSMVPGAKGQVEAKATEAKKKRLFAEIADKIAGKEWRAVVFESAIWPEIVDPVPIERGLKDYFRAHRDFLRLYKTLSPEDQKALYKTLIA
jgi:hypothetical protein